MAIKLYGTRIQTPLHQELFDFQPSVVTCLVAIDSFLECATMNDSVLHEVASVMWVSFEA